VSNKQSKTMPGAISTRMGRVTVNR